MVERGAQPLFSEAALTALDTRWEQDRRYGAALAGDRGSQKRIIDRVRREMPPRLDLTRVDDIVVWQAAGSQGDLDKPATTFQTYSCDHFRLPHIVAIATAAGDSALADRIADTTDRYAAHRPDTTELNRFRASLATVYLPLGGTHDVRAAPTTLSFLYGVIRTVIGALDRTSLLHVVAELEQRSVFWPVDLSAVALDSTLGAAVTPSDLTALIETADRCGLIIDLIDAASAKATSLLSLQLATGIRRIEGLLFPFATSRADLPSLD